MLIKLLVICTYENSNLLEKEIISLSEKYDLILPSWFENNSYYDKNSFLADISRVKESDIILILGDTSDLYNNFLLLEGSIQNKGLYCMIKNITFSLLRNVYSILLNYITDLNMLPISKYFKIEDELVNFKNIDENIIAKCRYFLSSFDFEPTITNNGFISFHWNSKLEDIGHLKYSVCLDILNRDTYSLKIKYYDEIVCNYQGNSDNIEHIIYLINKYLEDFNHIFS